MGRQLLAWLGLAALLVVAVVSAGWGGPSTGPGNRPATPSPQPEPVSAARAVALVRAVDIVPRDLPGRYRRTVARDATDLDAGDRLDLCGVAAPSQAFRMAAHRRAFVARSGERVHTEVVAYRPGRVAKALAALRALAPRCSRPVPPAPVEQPSTLALRVRTADLGERSTRHELLVLRRGDVLLLLEVDGAKGSLAVEVARRISARLESRLPDA
jgi:hypothetical protein